MNSKFILRKEIILSSLQQKMVQSGWGQDAFNSTIVEKITYLSDGLKVSGYVAYPQDVTKKYPCIIWCRGGFGNAGSIDEFNARGIFGQIASWGYVVFASQYRGNDGSQGIDEFGGSDVNDILNLIPLADEIDCADSNIWGIEGWSRGGMMTYLTLCRTSLFKCAITIGGISNLKCNSEENLFMKLLYEKLLSNNSTEDFNNKCQARSIINFTNQLSASTPMLILHGTADDRVMVHDSIDLAAKLKLQEHPHKLILFEGGDHFLKTHRKEVNEIRKNWFLEYLK